MAKLVTVGVPVFRGEDFVAEALSSLQAQTHEELEVLIYVDGPDPLSEEACRPFLTDSRFHMKVLRERVGWRNNLNLLMAASKGDYWYFNQQDDLVEPTYIETLLATPKRIRRRLSSIATCNASDRGRICSRRRRCLAIPRRGSWRCFTST